ncbi:Reverse transcriptase [Phytophthora palmivora]|uniref:Reverse transcriptase n=1 Tax=Phytophthora palmivora TaxID=4796 RepID=A0A2P4XNB2_9STRA|nr:Reverse transcriptase [Phytophthora palmivora]
MTRNPPEVPQKICQDEEAALRKSRVGTRSSRGLLRNSVRTQGRVPGQNSCGTSAGELPQEKRIQHEINLVLSTKYCVTRQWPLSTQQAKAMDDFFESRHSAGKVQESKFPYSAPTFCVQEPQGG